MAKFKVELEALVPVWCTLEVDADDLTDAMHAAVERAPRKASFWNVLESDEPRNVRAVDAAEHTDTAKNHHG